MKKYYPAAAWAVFILALSVGPSPNLPDTLNFEPDKAAHAFVYGVLVYLALRALRAGDKVTRSNVLKVVIFSILYGLLLEVLQKTFFPYRYFEWGDVLANTVGSVLGLIIFDRFNKRKIINF